MFAAATDNTRGKLDLSCIRRDRREVNFLLFRLQWRYCPIQTSQWDDGARFIVLDHTSVYKYTYKYNNGGKEKSRRKTGEERSRMREIQNRLIWVGVRFDQLCFFDPAWTTNHSKASPTPPQVNSNQNQPIYWAEAYSTRTWSKWKKKQPKIAKLISKCCSPVLPELIIYFFGEEWFDQSCASDTSPALADVCCRWEWAGERENTRGHTEEEKNSRATWMCFWAA